MPKFSIILPCHNAEDTLHETITSVLAQSHGDWELVCINDGSSDWTALILEGWATQDARVRVLTLSGLGPAVARNMGCAHARGDILCFLDADDIWDCEKLTQLARAFEDTAIDGVFAQVAFFAETGVAFTHSTVRKGALTIPMLMGENPVCTMSNFALRRTQFLKCGGFAQGFVHNEDLEWLIRLVGHGARIEGLPIVQVWYRTSAAGLSADLAAMATSRRQALKTARNFGFTPSAQSEAIYLRYLARRALRLNHTGLIALKFAAAGLWKSPVAFLFPLHRGALTALAALSAPLMPDAMRRALFAR